MKKIIRGEIFYPVSDPYFTKSEQDSYKYHQDGALIINTDTGKIEYIGDFGDLGYDSGVKIEEYKNSIIVPGFVDAHVHYPQTEMIAAYGQELLDWLNEYTYPTEIRFKDIGYCRKIARIFINTLIKNGVTTAAVFCTTFTDSVNALFEEAIESNIQIIAGKVLMDRGAPSELIETDNRPYDDTEMLINKWHNQGRFKYSITPRFAITSTNWQLQKAGEIFKKYENQGIYVHTHLSENKTEIKQVAELFPERKNYTDVYNHYGLLVKRGIYAHCVHLNQDEINAMHNCDGAVVHCPTSNLFLGSGLLDVAKLKQEKLNIAFGSDVGAGTSFSPLNTQNEAYKVSALCGQPMSPVKLFFNSTLGAAQALHLDDKIGNFAVGKMADIVVLNNHGTDLMKFRMQYAKNIEDKLFVHAIIGGEHSITATYLAGKKYIHENIMC